MITLAAARTLIEENVSPLPPVTVPLSGAFHRILRADIIAREDIPNFDRSSMDGYAIVAGDKSKRFRIVAEIQPGKPSKRKISRGQCARIFTGAPIPPGATQVLMQEIVRREGDWMTSATPPTTTHNIRYRGEDAKKEDKLILVGTKISACEMSLLASLGITRLKVSRPVRVAHFATGNELVSPAAKLRPGFIRDSNSTLVAALTRQFGGETVQQERLADDFNVLLRKTRAAKNACDLLLISGGASVGDYDFGKQLLTELGFKIHFASVNLRPGKPLVFATRGRQAAFVLPGNPVSHLVTLHVAVRLAFDCFLGATRSWPAIQALLADKLEAGKGGRETFWPARQEIKNGALVVHPLRWQSSGDVTGLIGANALLQLPANVEPPKVGHSVSALMLEVP